MLLLSPCRSFCRINKGDIFMNTVHLISSTNWNPRASTPDPDQMLGPLRTITSHLSDNRLALSKLILIKGSTEQDHRFCELVFKNLPEFGQGVEIDAKVDDGNPERIANYVSKAAEEATMDRSQLWIDLTPGPKQRTAIIFAVASALAGARLFYSESVEGGGFQVRPMPALGSYNQWLGRHGLRIRNYPEEISNLIELAVDDGLRGREDIFEAIKEWLGRIPDFETGVSSPHTELGNLAEWVYGKLPARFFNMNKYEQMMAINPKVDPLPRLLGRASQFTYQLRCLFHHVSSPPQPPQQCDALALLDGLAYLSKRLPVARASHQQITENFDGRMFIALDGDDVGRRFEEKLAECVNTDDVLRLRQWSRQMQQDLSEHILTLHSKWRGRFIARTGDGFLAAFDRETLEDLKGNFRPRLTGLTVTTGIGPSVKDAYLALKLGKAKNRGGGYYFSFQPPVEETLWPTVSE